MLRFDKIKVAKETFYGAKKPIKVWDGNVDNIVISKLVETKNNVKYLNDYLDDVRKPLVLTLAKICGYVKTFRGKGEYKNKNNKLMSLRIGDDNLLGKYKNIWIKIEDLKKIELNALHVFISYLLLRSSR